MPEYRVAKLADLPRGEMKSFALPSGQRLVLFHGDTGQVSALLDRCSHAEVRLSGGVFLVSQGQVECPAHGARFDVQTGRHMRMPAVSPVKAFQVKIVEDDIIIVAP